MNFNQLKNNYFFFITAVLLLSSTAHAWVISSGDFSTWQAQLVPKPEVLVEVQNFFTQEKKEASEAQKLYASEFVQTIHTDFSSRVKQILINAENPKLKCKPQSQVEFPGRLTQNLLGASFESEALRIEAMDCLGKLDHHKVFNVLMSDEFQKQTVTGLKKIQTREDINQVCQDTKIFGIGNSSYCLTQQIWANDSTYVIQSFNEVNNAGAESSVYFREVYTVIKKLSSGEVLFYNLAIGRGPKLPFHFIVKSTVKSEQAKVIESLIQAAQ